MPRLARLAARAAAVAVTFGCSSARTTQQAGSDAPRNAALVACTGCHGDTANANAAPPRSVRGTTATTDRAVGAHQAHLRDGTLRTALDCTECHVVPATISDAGHVDGTTATLTWGPLASAGGVAPSATVSSDGLSLTCTTYCHGASFPAASGSNHAPSWTRVDGTQAACGTCHGAPPPSPHPPVANGLAGCNGCHPGTVKADGSIDVLGGLHIDGVVEVAGAACTSCHGDATRTPAAIAPAPPLGTHGETSTTDRAVGAHQGHLVAGNVRAPIDCAECHVLPSATAHPSGTVEMSFGTLASAGGATPLWNGTTCTNYCHGATLDAGGAATQPTWTVVDGSQRQCGSCHGAPPPASSGHPSVGSALTGCASCHPDTVKADGTIDIAGGKHIDGLVEVSGTSCTSCHGDATRTPAAIAPAPPVDTHGNTATTAAGVGAHQRHLVGGSIRAAMACADCHAVPTDTTHSTQPLSLTWSALASNGTTPTWTASTLTCTNYCHGATLPGGTLTAPVWTGDSSQAACGTCHGAPPPASSGHPSVGSALTGCAACHPDTVKTDGTIDVAGGKHVNGVVDVSGTSCTSCHGDATRTPAAIAPAPPVDTHGNTATTAAGVGAHQAHLVAGPLRTAMACTDCHTVPTDTAHATQPLNLTWSALASQGTTPTWSASALTCTNYCHGATLSGGTDTTPVWTSGSSQAACGTCHGLPPGTGHHSLHQSRGIGCGTCHGSGYSSTAVNATLHVNGAKDVASGNPPGWNPTTRSCTNTCHGQNSW